MGWDGLSLMLRTLSGPYRTVHHRKLEVLSKAMSFQHLTEVKIHVGEWNASDAIEPESGWRQHVAHCNDFDVVAVAHVITVNANQKLQENVNLLPQTSRRNLAHARSVETFLLSNSTVACGLQTVIGDKGLTKKKESTMTSKYSVGNMMHGSS